MADAEKAACDQFLSGHFSRSASDILRSLADDAAGVDAVDVYGDGGAVSTLEKTVAELLGKPDALFFAKGMVAQMSALRVAADRAANERVVIHPQSHFDLDEGDALSRIAQLRPIRLGRHAPFLVTNLDALTETVGAVSVELPLRRAGYLLPQLAELEAISAWCRDRGTAFHIDGARLWEAAAAYDAPLDRVAQLADTVYVSFYKGLGGLGGAVLCGPQDVIAALRPWRQRHGGTLYAAYPYALSALAGLRQHLHRMPCYVLRARELAARLPAQLLIGQRAGPMANAFHLHVQGDPAELMQRTREFAQRTKVWLFNAAFESPIPGRSIVEVVIGNAADHWQVEEAVGWVEAFAGL